MKALAIREAEFIADVRARSTDPFRPYLEDKMDPDKVKAFLAEYRDLVHRHGLGLGPGGDGGSLGVIEVSDPDAHVAEHADERPSETKAAAAKIRRGRGEQSA